MMFNLINGKAKETLKVVTLRQTDEISEIEKYHHFSDLKTLVDYFVESAKSEVVSEITKNYDSILANKDFSMLENIINLNYIREWVSVDIFEDEVKIY